MTINKSLKMPNKSRKKLDVRQKDSQIAIFAAGCFWGVEELFRVLPGVIRTEVGYIGGKTKNPTYIGVCSHLTGHAEAVRIEYDPVKISYQELLKFFFENHNPTTINRQGIDIGDQYRSAIFYTTEEQKRMAHDFKRFVDLSGRWKNPVVTQIVPATAFYPAEDYHQQYLLKKGLKSCHA